MAIETSSSPGSALLRLRMKAVVVSLVRLIVKERAGEIRKLFAGSVTSLALQLRRPGGQGCIRPPNERVFVRL